MRRLQIQATVIKSTRVKQVILSFCSFSSRRVFPKCVDLFSHFTLLPSTLYYEYNSRYTHMKRDSHVRREEIAGKRSSYQYICVGNRVPVSHEIIAPVRCFRASQCANSIAIPCNRRPTIILVATIGFFDAFSDPTRAR